MTSSPTRVSSGAIPTTCPEPTCSRPPRCRCPTGRRGWRAVVTASTSSRGRQVPGTSPRWLREPRSCSSEVAVAANWRRRRTCRAVSPARLARRGPRGRQVGGRRSGGRSPAVRPEEGGQPFGLRLDERGVLGGGAPREVELDVDSVLDDRALPRPDIRGIDDNPCGAVRVGAGVGPWSARTTASFPPQPSGPTAPGGTRPETARGRREGGRRLRLPRTPGCRRPGPRSPA